MTKSGLGIVVSYHQVRVRGSFDLALNSEYINIEKRLTLKPVEQSGFAYLSYQAPTSAYSVWWELYFPTFRLI